MTKICLFGGTSEGRRLAAFLGKQDAEVTVCVATEYGEQMLENRDKIRLSGKKLSPEEIRQMMQEEHFDLVIDATHPYAVQVTENIAAACLETNTEYLRVLREGSRETENAVVFPDIPAAAGFLNTAEGNILLTTGSKELHKFAGIRDFADRVYVRVLPMQSSLEACTKAGVKPSHIIAMQGPFSEEMNTALINSVRARWLVTKDSGETGGFDAKAAAAQKTGAGLVVIGRPAQRTGHSEAEIITSLCTRYGFQQKPQVSIIGIGPGDPRSMTAEAVQAVRSADCLIGAKRMLDAVSSAAPCCFELISPELIAETIFSHPELQHFAVLMSGDSGFYSGTKRLLPLLENCELHIYPGISSLSYFCAKLNISYEDVFTLSLHGRHQDFIRDVRKHSQLFLLTGGDNSVSAICQKLCEAGLEDLDLSVGERLSYPDERITKGRPRELLNGTYDPLSVLLIRNDHPDAVVTHGLPDEAFRRDTGEKGVIPMTKSEIRSVCLSKLALTENAVCWDIGAGTGSVAIEMALQASRGMVYGIEKDAAAVSLSRENAIRLGAANVQFIHGTAPQACEGLPTPSRVFIGGSSGNLREIFRFLFSLHTEMLITATAVTLDSVTELYNIIGEYPFAKTEAVLLQTAKAQKAGEHHLMRGGNPVYLFTMRISGADQGC